MPATASTVNQTLTNYARGLAQDNRSAIAEFLAPTVPVSAANGQYKAYDAKNAFQVYDTNRAIGGGATRIEFAATDPYYNCTPQALEIAIDDHERDLAGEGDQLGLEEAKAQTLVTSAIIAHENRVVTAAKTVSATGAIGAWSNASNDPISDIDGEIEAIAIATGMMPNRILFGIGAWRVFRNHAKVVSRQPGAAIVGVNNAQAAQMMLNPGIEVQVGVLSKDATKFGAAKSASNIVGAEVFIFYASAGPTQFDPTAMKTFRTRRGGVDAVRLYRAESNRSDILAVDWSADVKVVNTEAIKRITIS
jgi:hypothetical protein